MHSNSGGIHMNKLIKIDPPSGKNMYFDSSFSIFQFIYSIFCLFFFPKRSAIMKRQNIMNLLCGQSN